MSSLSHLCPRNSIFLLLAGIAKAVQDKNANDARLAEEKAHDERVEQLLKGKGMFLPEYQKGNGFPEGIKAVVDKTGLDDIGKNYLEKL